MEKCIFIRYPEGFKAWKFYNPITKCTIISERAKFDEHYFPGLKHKWEQPRVNPSSPLIVSEYQSPISVVTEPDNEYDEPSKKMQPTADSPIPPMDCTSPAASPTPVPFSSPPPEPTEGTSLPQALIPSLLQRRAANPRINAGIRPKQWWTTREPAPSCPIQPLQTLSPSDEQEQHTNNDEGQTAVWTSGECNYTALSTRYADPQTFKEAMS